MITQQNGLRYWRVRFSPYTCFLQQKTSYVIIRYANNHGSHYSVSITQRLYCRCERFWLGIFLPERNDGRTGHEGLLRYRWKSQACHLPELPMLHRRRLSRRACREYSLSFRLCSLRRVFYAGSGCDSRFQLSPPPTTQFLCLKTKLFFTQTKEINHA